MRQKGKMLGFWGFITFLLLTLWLLCYSFEKFLGNSDGLLRGVVYSNVFKMLLCLDVLLCSLSFGLTSRQNIIQGICLFILSTLFSVLVLEGISYLVLELKFGKHSPMVFRRFYISPDVSSFKPYPAGDLDPVAGRLHAKNGSFGFRDCQGDSLHWSYNSTGQNDRQRMLSNPDTTKNRVAFIGDSFSEGYMVNNADRCSDILERKTGIEHLNFAVNGSNPVNYYLTYKNLAKPYGADIVVVGFLPANDFEVYNEQMLYKQVDWPVYVPYWQGTYPDYNLQYSLANVNQSILHGCHNQASLLKVVDSVYSTLSLTYKLKSDFLSHSTILQLLKETNAERFREGNVTMYEQFTDNEWKYVNYSLLKIIDEARGKKVFILSIPTLWDIKALKNGKTNRLDPALAKFCQQNKVDFIPLMSSFLRCKGNPSRFYVPCDGHWSIEGETFVANLLLSNPGYQSALKRPRFK